LHVKQYWGTVHDRQSRKTLNGNITKKKSKLFEIFMFRAACFKPVPSILFYFNSCRNFSATVRRDLMREKYLSLASTNVQGESGVLVLSSISSAAVM